VVGMEPEPADGTRNKEGGEPPPYDQRLNAYVDLGSTPLLH